MYYIEVLKKYAVFIGVASRKEYWMFVLINILIYNILVFLNVMLGGKITWVEVLYSVAIIVPSIAATVRRLHDTNHSGYYVFVGFIPIIGFVWFLILLLQPTKVNNVAVADSSLLPSVDQGQKITQESQGLPPQSRPLIRNGLLKKGAFRGLMVGAYIYLSLIGMASVVMLGAMFAFNDAGASSLEIIKALIFVFIPAGFIYVLPLGVSMLLLTTVFGIVFQLVADKLKIREKL